MHRFLRSIGFSTYQKKREIEKLLAELEQTLSLIHISAMRY